MEIAGAGATGRFAFAKLHGLGNDFVFFDDRNATLDLSVAQVRHLCDRRFGIGADGVILVRPAQRDDCDGLMYYINADGTLAQMCGNGVRCFAKYVVDRGIVDAARQSLVVETLAGPRAICFTTDDDDKLVRATVDMGLPILAPAAVPVDPSAADDAALIAAAERTERPQATSHAGVSQDAREPAAATALTLSHPAGASFTFVCVSMGNPHAVCFIDDFGALPTHLFKGAAPSLDSFDLDVVGAYFESHPAFPEKANVEFACVGSQGISMRVFERGCGETAACGTGACATLVAAAITGRSARENDVMLRGGTLHILWDENDHVIMTGPAEEAFTGEVELS